MTAWHWMLCAGLLLVPALPFSACAGQPQTIRVGSAEVCALLDVDRTMPVSIFDGAPEEVLLALAPGGEAPAGIYAFLIRLDGRVILTDAGLGRSNDPQSLLPQSLQAAGARPEDVTHVLLTHLHGDHVGGLAREGKAAFPNAEVLVSVPEKAFWFDDEALSKRPDKTAGAGLARRNLGLYGDRVKTFDFGDTVLPGIIAVDAAGHTPGHTAFLLESDGRRLLLWGDTVHAAALQFTLPQVCASFDMDPEQAAAARKRLMRMAADERIPVAGAHLPKPAFGRVDRKGGAFAFVPGAE